MSSSTGRTRKGASTSPKLRAWKANVSLGQGARGAQLQVAVDGLRADHQLRDLHAAAAQGARDADVEHRARAALGQRAGRAGGRLDRADAAGQRLGAAGALELGSGGGDDE